MERKIDRKMERETVRKIGKEMERKTRRKMVEIWEGAGRKIGWWMGRWAGR
jgi:hypothetical protein